MKTSRILIIVMTIVCLSCSSDIEQDSYVDLGDGFKYIKEYPQAIIYSTTGESPSSGINIIAPIVTNYGTYNNKIFAISREEPAIPTKNKSLYGKAKYWIVDKKDDIANLQPVDSALFYSELNRLDLKLNSE